MVSLFSVSTIVSVEGRGVVSRRGQADGCASGEATARLLKEEKKMITKQRVNKRKFEVEQRIKTLLMASVRARRAGVGGLCKEVQEEPPRPMLLAASYALRLYFVIPSWLWPARLGSGGLRSRPITSSPTKK